MKKVGVAILGLGVVGGGTYQTLVDHHDFYMETQQVDLSVEMVLDKNLERLAQLGVPEEIIAGSIEEVLANPNVDIVVETIGGIGVAKAFVTAALRDGKPPCARIPYIANISSYQARFRRFQARKVLFRSLWDQQQPLRLDSFSQPRGSW